MSIEDIIIELEKIEDKSVGLEVMVEGTCEGLVVLVVEADGEPYLEVRAEG